MLLDVLSTPSEAVQRAVSNCLPRLVQPLAGDKEFIQVGLDCFAKLICARGTLYPYLCSFVHPWSTHVQHSEAVYRALPAR